MVLSAIPCLSIGATIRGTVMEIHWGAGKASAANGYEVTLYRGVRGTSDFEKIAMVRTEIDGSFHFENLAKGEYTLHTGTRSIGNRTGDLAHIDASVS